MYDELVKLSHDFITTRARSYERYFVRTISVSHRCCFIVGERGVGKTTTVIQYLLRHANEDPFSKKILYIQADHFLLGNLTLYEIAEQFEQLGGEVIAFDEIHKYSNWSQELKSIYDTFPGLRIYASGSSALEIYKGTHDLSRRALIYTMYGQSLREFIEISHKVSLPVIDLEMLLEKHEEYSFDIIKQLKDAGLKVLPLFKQYLECGYYPFYFENRVVKEYWLMLEQNLHATIESDLTAINSKLTGNSVRKIKQLLSFISRSVPFVPEWKSIKAIVQVSDDRTLKSYFKYLEDAGVIYLLKRHLSRLKGLEGEEKIYLSNPNQIYALNYDRVNKGSLRETFFMSILKQSHQLSAPKDGDFMVDGKYFFEVGGKNKSAKQLNYQKNAFLALDDIEKGVGNKIPLWLFGFLY
ncbi:MAG: ATP-binding protein [Gammaproteobacteria bacterium]